jgi:Fe-S-cluster containining protein
LPARDHPDLLQEEFKRELTPSAFTAILCTDMNKISCRKGCGACCIAPSLSSAIPGMPKGKPAGMRCVQLSADNLCLLFDSSLRPAVCRSYQASEDCGNSRAEAMRLLEDMESRTAMMSGLEA